MTFSYCLDISGAGRRYSFLASDSLALLDVLIKRSIFVMNMLIFESKIFHWQFFSKICLPHILPNGHSLVMTLSSQNQKVLLGAVFVMRIYKRTPMLKRVATLLKPQFSMSVFPQVCCIYSEHFLTGAPPTGCFCRTDSNRN